MCVFISFSKKEMRRALPIGTGCVHMQYRDAKGASEEGKREREKERKNKALQFLTVLVEVERLVEGADAVFRSMRLQREREGKEERVRRALRGRRRHG